MYIIKTDKFFEAYQIPTLRWFIYLVLYKCITLFCCEWARAHADNRVSENESEHIEHEEYEYEVCLVYKEKKTLSHRVSIKRDNSNIQQHCRRNIYHRNIALHFCKDIDIRCQVIKIGEMKLWKIESEPRKAYVLFIANFNLGLGWRFVCRFEIVAIVFMNIEYQ